MKRSIFLLAASLLVPTGQLQAAPLTPKPNILLMVADDLGYRDLSGYGASKIATPRIDSVARDGVRFTDAHSFSGICMPSRYSILTGRYAFRIGRSMDYACNFDSGQVLLPMVLKSAGYRTAAFLANGIVTARLGYAQGFETYRDLFSTMSRNGW